MKGINRFSAIILSIALMSGIIGPLSTFAASDPSLGVAATFSIVAQTAITGSGTIAGDVGLNSTGAGITALTAGDVGGTIYSTDGVAPGSALLDPDVQANLSTANGNITAEASTDSIGPVLDGLIVSAGVHDIGAGRLNGGVLTLDGPGIYIFRASSDFISSGSIDLTNGARACDVYWQVDSLATINGTSFVGTIIAGTGVHFGAGVALDGRALALGGDVTLLNTTISGPTCATPPPPPPAEPELTVNKVVVNDDGGIKTVADFALFLDGIGIAFDISTTTTAGLHTVSETADPDYIATYSGDCAVDGTITLALGDVATCTITNDDIAPVDQPASTSGGSSRSRRSSESTPSGIVEAVNIEIDSSTTTILVSAPTGQVLGIMSPNLPHTGSPPLEDNPVFNTFIPISILIILLSLLYTTKTDNIALTK